jgi:hypothetical protein
MTGASHFFVAALLLGIPVSAAHDEEKGDTSGANPAALNRSAGMSNEYRFLDDDLYYNVIQIHGVVSRWQGKRAAQCVREYHKSFG